MFRAFPAHHQELNDCSGSLWFYLCIVVTVVQFSWSGRPKSTGDGGEGCYLEGKADDAYSFLLASIKCRKL